MQFEESPKFSTYKDGIPEPPPDSGAKQKRFRILLLGVLLLVLALGIYNFSQSKTAALLTSTGSVVGTAVDQNNQPFEGEIFILGTDLETTCDTNGRFLLERVPAGEQTLVVADDAFAREFPITVLAGKTVDVGQVQFIPTDIPPEG